MLCRYLRVDLDSILCVAVAGNCQDKTVELADWLKCLSYKPIGSLPTKRQGVGVSG